MPQAATARAPQSKACCFGGKQDLLLPDYIECSLTKRAGKRAVRKQSVSNIEREGKGLETIDVVNV